MIVLYFLFGLDILSMSMTLPVFGPYLRSLNVSHFTLGLINSGGALVSLLWNPIIGSLSDTKGRRNILINCMFAALVGNFLVGLTKSVPLIFVARIISAFGSPIQILLRTIVTDVTKTTEEKNAIFEKVGLVAAICFIFGALISGFISEVDNGVMYLFFLIAINFLVSIVLACSLPDDNKAKKSKKANNLSMWKNAFGELKLAVINLKNISWPRYWEIFAIRCAIDFGFGLLVSNMGLILSNDFKIKGRNMGFFFMFVSICGVVFRIVNIKLKNLYPKDSDYVKIIHGATLMAASFLGLGFSYKFYQFVVSAAFMSIAKTFLDSTLTEVITSKTTNNDKGKVISAFENLVPLTMFVAPLVSGFLADITGERTTIILGSVPLLVSIALCYNAIKVKTK